MVSELVHIDESLEEILREVNDPEIPVLSVMDMGVIRHASLKDGKVFIRLTPTYSGCPAMDVIGDDLRKAMADHGYDCEVELVLAPAWTTDWITERGRKALEKYGIAAPLDPIADKAALLDGERIVKCTNCGSQNTYLVSQFGSTACKALFKCSDCDEPFDYFKCLK